MSVVSAKSPVLEFTTTALSTQASSATLVTIFSRVLPEGKYLITGSVNVSGSLTDVVVSLGAIRTLFRETATATILNAPISFLYQSDGSTALVLQVSALTSASTWASASTLFGYTAIPC